MHDARDWVIAPGRAKRRLLEATLADLGAKHIRVPLRMPRWNGKVEWFIRTLDEEWAHARIWSSSTTRNRALKLRLRY